MAVRSICLDPGASHRRLAESLGATWVGSEKEKPPVELDRAVTFAPSGDVVVAALSSLRKGGVVAINAIHLDRIPEFDYDRLLVGRTPDSQRGQYDSLRCPGFSSNRG